MLRVIQSFDIQNSKESPPTGEGRPGPTQAGLGGLSREPKFGKSNINIYILF